VRVPRRLGIAATHARVPVFTRNEDALVAAPWSAIPALRDMAGAARQFRQAPAARSMDRGVAEAAGAFLGPFCGAFAAWALQRARAHGLRRLYFCARDCQMTWKAARLLAGEPADVDCRYLYVSRQALFLPSVRHANRAELRHRIHANLDDARRTDNSAISASAAAKSNHGVHRDVSADVSRRLAAGASDPRPAMAASVAESRGSPDR